MSRQTVYLLVAGVVAAFEAARKSDAVLFFDEADSILGRRLTNVTQSADHGVNVSRSTMLLQLDRFEGVVLFATNLVRNYDGAFVRRLLGHVEVPLPDLECRIKLAQRFLRPRMPRAADVTEAWFAGETDGLSGGELLQVVIAAATRTVQRIGDARVVTRDDLQTEIADLWKARNAVDQNRRPRVTEELVDDAPERPPGTQPSKR